MRARIKFMTLQVTCLSLVRRDVTMIRARAPLPCPASTDFGKLEAHGTRLLPIRHLRS